MEQRLSIVTLGVADLETGLEVLEVVAGRGLLAHSAPVALIVGAASPSGSAQGGCSYTPRGS